ncbi:hypothetical protein N656DRAFT_842586 [Canariomyces notabilis]|uniref:Chromosome transmission fidelity protein 4 n=1 Tax=Canariomyces notabilis TaxID=2074819 RepID=A0AAN6TJR2_9PEZI|nr:hypothetical protein N656DRAFT_842586 [Canariomyces arenarius]
MSIPTRTRQLRCLFRRSNKFPVSEPRWTAIAAIERQLPRHSSSAGPVTYPSTDSQPPRPSPTTAQSSSPSHLRATAPSSNPNTKLPELWFTSAPDPNRPPDDRKVKLGKTLRILQTHLPTLLQTPLPNEVLSPQISLHLFPSTHPHLPTVTGRVAYRAALWSSPIAWNRVPIVGNVRLEILSERMVDHPVYRHPFASSSSSAARGGGGLDGEGRAAPDDGRERAGPEQLIVRWRTVGGKEGKGTSWLGGLVNGKVKGRGRNDVDADGRLSQGEGGGSGNGGNVGDTEVRAPVGTAQPVGASTKEFTGLFIFDFDEEGRILSHTIEHVQEGGHWEKGVGAKVVGLTDWLLGGMKGGEEPCPAFARARFRKGR